MSCFFNAICDIERINCSTQIKRAGVQYAVLHHFLDTIWKMMSRQDSSSDEAMEFAESNFPGILKHYGVNDVRPHAKTLTENRECYFSEECPHVCGRGTSVVSTSNPAERERIQFGIFHHVGHSKPGSVWDEMGSVGLFSDRSMRIAEHNFPGILKFYGVELK